MAGRRGQRPETYAKYAAAVRACKSPRFLNLNVSQIAQLFGLSGPALANQLRNHYPEVIPEREAERQRLGYADNIHHGARPQANAQYARAVELLTADPTLSVKAAAEQTDVSFGGLRQHLIFYHHSLLASRRNPPQ